MKKKRFKMRKKWLGTGKEVDLKMNGCGLFADEAFKPKHGH